MFSQDFKEFIELLIKNKAEYLIVGGYAVDILISSSQNPSNNYKY